jgi:hypothetical protein
MEMASAPGWLIPFEELPERRSGDDEGRLKLLYLISAKQKALWASAKFFRIFSTRADMRCVKRRL